MELVISLWKRKAAKEVFIGLALSILFIGANYVIPQFAIGFPSYQSFASGAVIVILLASIFEEIFFRFFLLNLAAWVRLAPLFVYIFGTAAFAIFHYAAYGESLSAQGASFVGAAIFAAIAIYITLKRKNIIPSVVMHASFNAWLFARLNGVI